MLRCLYDQDCNIFEVSASIYMKTLVTEKILVYKVRTKRDPDAFSKLYDFYIEPIYRFVYFKLSNKEDSEDITSEVFLKAWNYLISEEKEVNNFRQLIYRIARNRVIDVYRERAKKSECSIETIEIAATDNIIHSIELAEEKVELINTIKKLKHEYQEVIHLRYVEGLSVRDIAVILDKKYANVRVILHRAIKKLKELSVRTPN